MKAAKQNKQAVATLRQAILLDPKNVNLYLDSPNSRLPTNHFRWASNVNNDGVELQAQAAPLYLRAALLY